MTLETLYTEATSKLNNLNIPLEYLADESGQTSATDHLTWIINASETELQQWIDDMGE